MTVSILRVRFAATAIVVIGAGLCTCRGALAQSPPPRLVGPIRTLSGNPLDSTVGTVTDVGLDAERNVYVLDGARGVVVVFRWDGAFVASASLDSQTIVAAKAMAVTATGRIFVLPADGHELAELQLEGQRLRRLGRFPIAVGGGDLCAGNRSIFIVGFDPRSRSLVHEYGLGGQPGRQFGADLTGKAPGWAAADFQGRIGCSDGAVALGSGFSPTVELYDDAGRLRWRRDVSPYRGLLVQPLPGNGYSLAIPPGGVDVVRRVLLFHGTVVVQLGRSSDVALRLATLLFATGSEGRPAVPSAPWPLVRRIYGAWALTATTPPHLAVAIYHISTGS
jgi:hypothetical protein